jgi:flagellar L-ring protein precursor FlgH
VAAGLVPNIVSNLPGFARDRAGRITNGLKLDGSEISSEATGSADQRASLSGSVAVTVTQVLSNGNLVVRGEKVLDLSEGSETIRVAGIVRSEDIAPNGTVFSRRLANAQIAYTGTGDLANANKVPWGTGILMKLWPF